MCQYLKYMVIICVLSLSFADTHSDYSEISLRDIGKQSGAVIFLRHAFAPGLGDPPNFIIGQCDTQRNLNSAGRHQSKQLGEAFRKVGLQNLSVLSSPWCRCIDTARLMNVGVAKVFTGLSSFYEGHVSRASVLKELNAYLESINQTDHPTLLVTHQVVISAVTGLSSASGEAIIYFPSSKIARRVLIPRGSDGD